MLDLNPSRPEADPKADVRFGSKAVIGPPPVLASDRLCWPEINDGLPRWRCFDSRRAYRSHLMRICVVSRRKRLERSGLILASSRSKSGLEADHDARRRRRHWPKSCSPRIRASGWMWKTAFGKDQGATRSDTLRRDSCRYPHNHSSATGIYAYPSVCCSRSHISIFT